MFCYLKGTAAAQSLVTTQVCSPAAISQAKKSVTCHGRGSQTLSPSLLLGEVRGVSSFNQSFFSLSMQWQLLLTSETLKGFY